MIGFVVIKADDHNKIKMTRKHKKRMGAGWKPAASLGAVSTIEIESAKFLDEIVKEINAENK